MAMESNTEIPGTFAPPSRLVDTKIQATTDTDSTGTTTTTTSTQQTTNKKLLWMDRQAMEELTSCESDCHPPLFVEINTNDENMKNKNSRPNIIYPVNPTQELVGEFKVTPAIHAGYAVTWFGLSGAGMVMTRKLLTRGR